MRHHFKRNTRIIGWLAHVTALIAAGSALVAAQSLPQVRLEAEGLGPRPIEELTQTTITHHYALAWRDMASALDSGQTGTLGEEFTGFERERLIRRVKEQNQAGVHIRIVDHGHQLKAVFYSTDGMAMQLIDHAQLEIQTFDGSKLIETESALHQYVVIMTPGADRWYVRDMEELPSESANGG